MAREPDAAGIAKERFARARRAASVSLLRTVLETTVARVGVKVVTVPAPNTTQCSYCGHLNTFAAPEALEQTCQSGGRT